MSHEQYDHPPFVLLTVRLIAAAQDDDVLLALYELAEDDDTTAEHLVAAAALLMEKRPDLYQAVAVLGLRHPRFSLAERLSLVVFFGGTDDDIASVLVQIASAPFANGGTIDAAIALSERWAPNALHALKRAMAPVSTLLCS